MTIVVAEKGEAMIEWIVIISACLMGLITVNIVFFTVISNALEGTKTGKAIDEAMARRIRREEKR